MYVSAETFWAAIGALTALFSTIGAAFMWLGRLAARVSGLEDQMNGFAAEREHEREDREAERRDFGVTIAALRGEMQILNNNIATAREQVLGRFAAIPDVRRQEERTDALNGRVGTLESGQAELRATSKAILESVGDIKRSLERRP